MDSTNMPLVSVVTPLYNNREFLEECIEIVRAQTYQNWDYTIVNNCSTDGSAEIAYTLRATRESRFTTTSSFCAPFPTTMSPCGRSLPPVNTARLSLRMIGCSRSAWRRW